jgi:hypothetical protein
MAVAAHVDVVASKGIRAVCSGADGFNGSKMVEFTYTLSDDYPDDGGEPLHASLIGVGKPFENGVLLVSLETLDTTGAYLIRYDHTTGHVLASAVSGDPGALGEAANSADLKAIVVEGYAIGY